MSKETFDYHGYLMSLGYAEEDIPVELSDEEKDEIYARATQGTLQEYIEEEKILNPNVSKNDQITSATIRMIQEIPETREALGIPEQVTDEQEPYDLRKFADFVSSTSPGETNLDEPIQNYLGSYADSLYNKFMPIVRPFLKNVRKEEFQKHFMEANGIDKDTTVNDVMVRVRTREPEQAVGLDYEPEPIRTGSFNALRSGLAGFLRMTVGDTLRNLGDFFDNPSLSLRGTLMYEAGERARAQVNYAQKYNGVVETWREIKEKEGWLPALKAASGAAFESALRNTAATGYILLTEFATGLAIAGFGAAAAPVTGGTSTAATVAGATKTLAGLRKIGKLLLRHSPAIGVTGAMMIGEPTRRAIDEGVYDSEYASNALLYGLASTVSEYAGFLAMRGVIGIRKGWKATTDTELFKRFFGRAPVAGEAEAVKSFAKRVLIPEAFAVIGAAVEEGGTEAIQDWLQRSYARSLGAEISSEEAWKEGWNAFWSAVPLGGGVRAGTAIHRIGKEFWGEGAKKKRFDESRGILEGNEAVRGSDLSAFDPLALNNTQILETEDGKTIVSYGGTTVEHEGDAKQAMANLIAARKINLEPIDKGENDANITVNEDNTVASISFGESGAPVTYRGENAKERLSVLIDEHNDISSSPFMLTEGMTIEVENKDGNIEYYVTFANDPFSVDGTPLRRRVDSLHSRFATNPNGGFAHAYVQEIPASVAVAQPRSISMSTIEDGQNIPSNLIILRNAENPSGNGSRELVLFDKSRNVIYKASLGVKNPNTGKRNVSLSAKTHLGKNLELDDNIRNQVVEELGEINLGAPTFGFSATKTEVAGKESYHLDLDQAKVFAESIGATLDEENSTTERATFTTAFGRNMVVRVVKPKGSLLVEYNGDIVQVKSGVFDLADAANLQNSVRPAFGLFGYDFEDSVGVTDKIAIRRVWKNVNGNNRITLLYYDQDGNFEGVSENAMLGDESEEEITEEMDEDITSDVLSQIPGISRRFRRGYAIKSLDGAGVANYLDKNGEYTSDSAQAAIFVEGAMIDAIVDAEERAGRPVQVVTHYEFFGTDENGVIDNNDRIFYIGDTATDEISVEFKREILSKTRDEIISLAALYAEGVEDLSQVLSEENLESSFNAPQDPFAELSDVELEAIHNISEVGIFDEEDENETTVDVELSEDREDASQDPAVPRYARIPRPRNIPEQQAVDRSNARRSQLLETEGYNFIVEVRKREEERRKRINALRGRSSDTAETDGISELSQLASSWDQMDQNEKFNRLKSIIIRYYFLGERLYVGRGSTEAQNSFVQRLQNFISKIQADPSIGASWKYSFREAEIISPVMRRINRRGFGLLRYEKGRRIIMPFGGDSNTSEVIYGFVKLTPNRITDNFIIDYHGNKVYYEITDNENEATLFDTKANDKVYEIIRKIGGHTQITDFAYRTIYKSNYRQSKKYWEVKNFASGMKIPSGVIETQSLGRIEHSENPLDDLENYLRNKERKIVRNRFDNILALRGNERELNESVMRKIEDFKNKFEITVPIERNWTLSHAINTLFDEFFKYYMEGGDVNYQRENLGRQVVGGDLAQKEAEAIRERHILRQMCYTFNRKLMGNIQNNNTPLQEKFTSEVIVDIRGTSSVNSDFSYAGTIYTINYNDGGDPRVISSDNFNDIKDKAYWLFFEKYCDYLTKLGRKISLNGGFRVFIESRESDPIVYFVRAENGEMKTDAIRMGNRNVVDFMGYVSSLVMNNLIQAVRVTQNSEIASGSNRVFYQKLYRDTLLRILRARLNKTDFKLVIGRDSNRGGRGVAKIFYNPGSVRLSVIPSTIEIRTVDYIRTFFGDSSVYRDDQVNTLRVADPDDPSYYDTENFGNPFSHEARNTSAVFNTTTVKEAVDLYNDWLTGNLSAEQIVERVENTSSMNERELVEHLNARREWILGQIDSGNLDNKTLVYYTENIPTPSGYEEGVTKYDEDHPSHVHILKRLINERNEQTRRLRAIRLEPQLLKTYDIMGSNRNLFNDLSEIVRDVDLLLRWSTVRARNIQEIEEGTSETILEGYKNYSGGAAGADTAWGHIGRNFGVETVNWYPSRLRRPADEGGAGVSFDLENTYVELTKEQETEGLQKAQEAWNKIRRGASWGDRGNYATRKLWARSWFQVKDADAIFAVGFFKGSLSGANASMIDGGTAAAIQMAMDNGSKPIYFFNQVSYQDSVGDTILGDPIEVGWYKYNYDNRRFEPMSTLPVLTEKFAGIGTRRINGNGWGAIADVYRNTVYQKQRSESAAPVAPVAPVAPATPTVPTTPDFYGMYFNGRYEFRPYSVVPQWVEERNRGIDEFFAQQMNNIENIPSNSVVDSFKDNCENGRFQIRFVRVGLSEKNNQLYYLNEASEGRFTRTVNIEKVIESLYTVEQVKYSNIENREELVPIYILYMNNLPFIVDANFENFLNKFSDLTNIRNSIDGKLYTPQQMTREVYQQIAFTDPSNISIPESKDGAIWNWHQLGRGTTPWFSNFYLIEGGIIYNGEVYESSEAAYQAAKVDYCRGLSEEARINTKKRFARGGDWASLNEEEMSQIRSIRKKAFEKGINLRKYGKDLERGDGYNFDNSGWQKDKERILREINEIKFSNISLQDMLLSTGVNCLIEGHAKSRTWGMVWDGKKWNGQNKMGNILMDIRHRLAQERVSSFGGESGRPSTLFRSTSESLKRQRNAYIEAISKSQSPLPSPSPSSLPPTSSLQRMRSTGGFFASFRFFDSREGMPKLYEDTGLMSPDGARARSIEDELVAHYGESILAQVVSGQIVILENQEAARNFWNRRRQDPIYSVDGVFQGFCDREGVIYLVRDGIRDGDVHRVVVHEKGVHAGFLGFTRSRDFQSILQYLRDHIEDATSEGLAIKRAFNRAFQMTKDPDEVWIETLAYLCEENADNQYGIIRRFIAAVKKWLFEHGILDVSRFSVDDFVIFAQAAARVPLRQVEMERYDTLASRVAREGLSINDTESSLLLFSQRRIEGTTNTNEQGETDVSNIDPKTATNEQLYVKTQSIRDEILQDSEFKAILESIDLLKNHPEGFYERIAQSGGDNLFAGLFSGVINQEDALKDPVLAALFLRAKALLHKITERKEFFGQPMENVTLSSENMKAMANAISGLPRSETLSSTATTPEEALAVQTNIILLEQMALPPQNTFLEYVQNEINSMLDLVEGSFTYGVEMIDGEETPVIYENGQPAHILRGVAPTHAAGAIEHLVFRGRVTRNKRPSDTEQEDPFWYDHLLNSKNSALGKPLRSIAPQDFSNVQAKLDPAFVDKILNALPPHIRERIQIHSNPTDQWTHKFLVEPGVYGLFLPMSSAQKTIHIRDFDISKEDFIRTVSEEVGHYSWQLFGNAEMDRIVNDIYDQLRLIIQTELKNYLPPGIPENKYTTFDKLGLINELFSKYGINFLNDEDVNKVFNEEGEIGKKFKNQYNIDAIKNLRKQILDEIGVISTNMNTAVFSDPDAVNADFKQFFEQLLITLMSPAHGKAVVASFPRADGRVTEIRVNDWGQMRRIRPKTAEAAIRQKIMQIINQQPSDIGKLLVTWRFDNLPFNFYSPQWFVNFLGRVVDFVSFGTLRNSAEWIRIPGGFTGDTTVGKDVSILLSRAYQSIYSDYGLRMKKEYVNMTKFADYLRRNNLNPDLVDKKKGYVAFMQENGLDDKKMLEMARDADLFMQEATRRIEDNVLRIRQEFQNTLNSLRLWGARYNLSASAMKKIEKEITDTMKNFKQNYSHRAYRAYTPEDRVNINEMQQYLMEENPVNFLTNKLAEANRKKAEAKLEFDRSQKTPDDYTKYRRASKEADHLQYIYNRLKGLQNYASAVVNGTAKRIDDELEIDISEVRGMGSNYAQQTHELMKKIIEKIAYKNVETRRNKQDKQHSRFNVIAGVMRRKFDNTVPHELGYMTFLDEIKNPMESVLLSLDQQEKILNKLAFNRILGEKILETGMGYFKLDPDKVLSPGMTKIGFGEKGTFLSFLALETVFDKAFEREYDVASKMVDNAFWTRYFSMTRANLTVYNPKLAISNYISNVGVGFASGHLFRIANIMSGLPIIRDDFLKRFKGREANPNAFQKQILDELVRYQVIGGSSSSTEMKIYTHNNHEKFISFLTSVLERVTPLSQAGKFSIDNFMFNLLEKAREIYGYGDEWLKIIAYLNNREIAMAKYEAEFDSNDPNYTTKVREAAAKDAANLTQLEMTTWELSPMIIRQLAGSSMRILTPDFIMHNFQILRMMTVGIGRMIENGNEIKRMRAIENRTVAQDKYLNLLMYEAARRWSGFVVGSTMIGTLMLCPAYLIPYLSTVLIPSLFGGGDDGRPDDENRHSFTTAEHTGAQMLLNSLMDSTNLWAPAYRKDKYTFLATNHQRQDAAQTLFAPPPATETPTLMQYGVNQAKMVINLGGENILGQVYNGLRGKDRYGQQVGLIKACKELITRGVVPEALNQAAFTGSALTSWAVGEEAKGRTIGDMVTGKPARQHLAHKLWEFVGASVREYDIRDMASSRAYEIKHGIGNAQNPVRRDFIEDVINNPEMSDSRMVSKIREMMQSNEQRMGRAIYAVNGLRYWGLSDNEIIKYFNKGRNAPKTTILSEADARKIVQGKNIFDYHILTALEEKREIFAGKLGDDSKYTREQRRQIVDTIDRFMAKYKEMMGERAYVPSSKKSPRKVDDERPTGNHVYNRGIKSSPIMRYQQTPIARGDGDLEITSVYDGDTFKGTKRGQLFSYRIANMDAREMGQEGGAQDRAAMMSLIAGSDNVRIKPLMRDKYGRIVAEAYVDGKLLAEEMIGMGAAREYYTDRNVNDPEMLTRLRAAASRANAAGLAPTGQSPEEFRRIQ